jgi:hypothetical protein
MKVYLAFKLLPVIFNYMLIEQLENSIQRINNTKELIERGIEKNKKVQYNEK